MMFKKNKGFTLVEIVSVIAILGLLALVAVPAVSRVVKENREKIYAAQYDSVIESARIYSIDNIKKFIEGYTYKLTVGQLVYTGYSDIKNDIRNKSDNKCINYNTIVEILVENNGAMKYSLSNETCDNDLQDKFVKLNGEFINVINKNSSYNELNVKNSSELSGGNVVISGAVDTSDPNIYYITYQYKDGDKVIASAIRNVVVLGN